MECAGAPQSAFDGATPAHRKIMGALEVEAKPLAVSGLTKFLPKLPISPWPPLPRGIDENPGGMTGEAADPQLHAAIAPSIFA
jgi:hypothetical protein